MWRLADSNQQTIMGSSLGSLTDAQHRSLDELAGHTVAIDGHLCLYQFLTGITDDWNDYVRNHDAEPISHLIGLLGRLGSTLDAGIYPVMVFDGDYPSLKDEEVARRASPDAEEAFWEAKAAGDKERARQLAYQKVRVTDEMIDSTTDLLDAMGVPVFRAPCEGEPQCAQLVHDGLADHVVTEDWDTLLYEPPSMLRGYCSSSVQQVHLDDVLDAQGWTIEELRWYAILLGTDYNKSPHGVGPTYAAKIVNNAPSFDEVLNAALTYDQSIDVDRWREVLALFDAPEVATAPDLSFGTFDPDAVYDTLVGRYGLAHGQVQSKLNSMEVEHL